MPAIFAVSDRPSPDKVRLLGIKPLNGLPSDAPLPEKLQTDPRCTLQTEDKTGFLLFHRQQPLEIHRLQRGELSKPHEVVGPAVPAALVLPNFAADFASIPPPKRRATLAHWLTSPNNALPARG